MLPAPKPARSAGFTKAAPLAPRAITGSPAWVPGVVGAEPAWVVAEEATPAAVEAGMPVAADGVNTLHRE